MQEPYNEGLLNHIDPESCGYVGNGISEALTGVHAGRVLSRVSLYIVDRSADAVENVGRQHWVCHYSKNLNRLTKELTDGWSTWLAILHQSSSIFLTISLSL